MLDCDGRIVMTLLMPRNRKAKRARYAYAVQMAIPKEMTPGKTTSLVSVRLIHNNGVRATAPETMGHYDPKKWRAASLPEQSQFVLEFHANPQPWYSVVYSLSKSIFRYRGSGDRDTNNGQRWPEIESLDKKWRAEQNTRNRCEEVLAAEWDRRMAEWGEDD